jgi:hypothetical protein
MKEEDRQMFNWIEPIFDESNAANTPADMHLAF